MQANVQEFPWVCPEPAVLKKSLWKVVEKKDLLKIEKFTGRDLSFIAETSKGWFRVVGEGRKDMVLAVCNDQERANKARDKLLTVLDDADKDHRKSVYLCKWVRKELGLDPVAMPSCVTKRPIGTEGACANPEKKAVFWDRWDHPDYVKDSREGIFQIQAHRFGGFGSWVRGLKGSEDICKYRIILRVAPQYLQVASSDDWEEILDGFEWLRDNFSCFVGKEKEWPEIASLVLPRYHEFTHAVREKVEKIDEQLRFMNDEELDKLYRDVRTGTLSKDHKLHGFQGKVREEVAMREFKRMEERWAAISNEEVEVSLCNTKSEELGKILGQNGWTLQKLRSEIARFLKLENEECFALYTKEEDKLRPVLTRLDDPIDELQLQNRELMVSLLTQQQQDVFDKLQKVQVDRKIHVCVFDGNKNEKMKLFEGDVEDYDQALHFAVEHLGEKRGRELNSKSFELCKMSDHNESFFIKERSRNKDNDNNAKPSHMESTISLDSSLLGSGTVISPPPPPPLPPAKVSAYLELPHDVKIRKIQGLTNDADDGKDFWTELAQKGSNPDKERLKSLEYAFGVRTNANVLHPTNTNPKTTRVVSVGLNRERDLSIAIKGLAFGAVQDLVEAVCCLRFECDDDKESLLRHLSALKGMKPTKEEIELASSLEGNLELPLKFLRMISKYGLESWYQGLNTLQLMEEGESFIQSSKFVISSLKECCEFLSSAAWTDVLTNTQKISLYVSRSTHPCIDIVQALEMIQKNRCTADQQKSILKWMIDHQWFLKESLMTCLAMRNTFSGLAHMISESQQNLRHMLCQLKTIHDNAPKDVVAFEVEIPKVKAELDTQESRFSQLISKYGAKVSMSVLLNSIDDFLTALEKEMERE